MKIVLFGSGQGGQMAAQWLPAGWELLAFIDNDPGKQGTHSGNLPVLGPDSILSLAPDLILITVLNREAACKIELQLRE